MELTWSVATKPTASGGRRPTPPALHPGRPIAAGAEPWLHHLTRIRAAPTTILDRHPHHPFLVVAHGETVTSAHHLFLDISPDRLLPLAFATDQASLTIWR